MCLAQSCLRQGRLQSASIHASISDLLKRIWPNRRKCGIRPSRHRRRTVSGDVRSICATSLMVKMSGCVCDVLLTQPSRSTIPEHTAICKKATLPLDLMNRLVYIAFRSVAALQWKYTPHG